MERDRHVAIASVSPPPPWSERSAGRQERGAIVNTASVAAFDGRSARPRTPRRRARGRNNAAGRPRPVGDRRKGEHDRPGIDRHPIYTVAQESRGVQGTRCAAGTSCPATLGRRIPGAAGNSSPKLSRRKVIRLRPRGAPTSEMARPDAVRASSARSALLLLIFSRASVGEAEALREAELNPSDRRPVRVIPSGDRSPRAGIEGEKDFPSFGAGNVADPCRSSARASSMNQGRDHRRTRRRPGSGACDTGRRGREEASPSGWRPCSCTSGGCQTSDAPDDHVAIQQEPDRGHWRAAVRTHRREGSHDRLVDEVTVGFGDRGAVGHVFLARARGPVGPGA